MAIDPNKTSSLPPSNGAHQPDKALEAGLAVAFGRELTASGWTRPPLLRDDPSGVNAIVQPGSQEMPKGSSERYQLLGEIARGGMGVILKGRDPDLGRDLAFKVLKADISRRPEAIQRFVEEAQVSGQLQHPGVVPVYDLGRFEDGRPFFAMKLVKGRTLADLLAERSSPAQDRGRYLQNFLQVCHTIAYAHAKGVIHRDLKPSNVMIGSFNEVLVMDWGLAKVLSRGGVADERKATEASRSVERPPEEPTVIRTDRQGSGSETEAGSMMGTPAYMPPEQAGGEIDKLDERADVFGLGAILCVILTGDPPYRAKSGEEVRLMAIRGQLTDAYKRLDECDADGPLVELCKKCLAADPNERPRDAGRVAEAVITYQSSVADRLHQSELEQAEQRVRLKEAIRRRRVQAALGLAFTALIVVAGTFAWWRENQRRANEARVELALNGVQVMLTQAKNDPDKPIGRWKDAQTALEKAESLLGGDESGTTRERLESLRAAIDSGLKESESNQLLLVQLDRIRHETDGDEADEAFAKAFQDAGLDADALSAADFQKRLADKPPAVRGVVPAMLDFWAMSRRGTTDRQDTKVDKGVRHLFTLSNTVDTDPWRVDLRKSLQGQDLIRLHDLASKPAELNKQDPAHLWLLGLGLSLNGDNTGAIDVLEPAVRKHPDDYMLTLELAFAKGYTSRAGINIANAVATSTNVEDYKRAEPYLRAAVALRPKSFHPHLALANALMHQERHAEADAEFRIAIDLAAHRTLPICLYGEFLKKTGKNDESLAMYRQALALNPASPRALSVLGKEILDQGGSPDEYLALYRKAAEHKPRVGVSLLFDQLWSFGQHDEATDVMKKAIAQDPTWRTYRYDLGHIYRHAQNKSADAIKLFEDALQQEPDDVHYLIWLAQAQGDARKFEDARKTCEKVLALEPSSVWTQYAMGEYHIRTNQPEKAIPYLRKSIELMPLVAHLHYRLMDALVSTKQLDTLIPYYDRQIERDRKIPILHLFKGYVYERLKKTDEAKQSYLAALAIDPNFSSARFTLARMLLNERQFDECIRICREGLELDEKQSNLSALMANVQLQQGKTDEAVETAMKGLKANPGDHAARHTVSIVLTRAQRWDKAAEALEIQINQEPNLPVLNYQLGLLHERLGQNELAAKAHAKAMQLAPNNVPYQFNTAIVLDKLGRTSEAEKLLERIPLSDPSSEGGLHACIACRAGLHTELYHKLRKDMLDRYAKDSDFRAIDHTTKIWLLDPALKEELPTLVALAERALTDGKSSEYYRKHWRYVRMTRALAALRAEDGKRAVEECDAALKDLPRDQGGGYYNALEAGCRAITAMAMPKEAARREDAIQELDTAETILQKTLYDPNAGSNRVNLLFARVLADEAASRLGVRERGPAPREVKK